MTLKYFTAGVVLLGFIFSITGCTSTVSPKRFTQAQLTAIETRIVDASMDDTYSAASSALFDAGYTISMSDRAGGLLTGAQGKDNTAARIWISPYIRDTSFVISIQVKSSGSRTSDVRIKTSINGQPTVDKKAIDQIWILMQRQVLMRLPPPVSSSAATELPAGKQSINNQSAKQTANRQDEVDQSKYSDSTQKWISGKVDD
jgi:hypothetical protein